MKINLVLAILTFSASIGQLKAQYASSESYNLGAFYGHGWSKGPATDQSALFTQGTFHTRTDVFAFIFNFATVKHKKGFNPGLIFNMALGGSNDRFMGEDLGAGYSDRDGKWGSDFGLYIDWKVGFSLNYSLPDQQTTFGLRYFNWYQGNAFGGTYSNADDAAAIGLTSNYKKFGFSYSYGSAKIPGVLVNSQAWNSNEIELRYQLVYKEKTLGGTILGIRCLRQTLQPSANTKGTLISGFVLFH